ncbi:MAG TPA: glycosyltransferase family 4 protein [Chthoniobacterales bacterium]
MKITIVQGPYFPVPPLNGGAIEKVWFGLGKEFVSRGHEVTHFSRCDTRLPNLEVIDGVTHRRVPSFDRPKSMLGTNFFDLLYSLQVVPRLPPADILVTNTFWLPVLERRRSRGKIYVHIARFPRRQMALYRHVARLQSVSNVIKDAVVEQTPEVEPIARMIPNSLPFDFEIPESVPVRTPERFEIVYIGRIHPEKGIEILLEAFEKFLAMTRIPTRLRIVGPDAQHCGGGGEEYGRSLRERAAPLGSAIEWCAPVFTSQELQAYYSSSHVLVYPSIAAKGEASPLTPVEAMASGCVPIVSNLKCFADYLEDGVNGFTFELAPNPTDNLAAVLNKVSLLGEGLRPVQQKCLEVAETYSLKNVATQYENDFLSLLETTPEKSTR